MKRIHHHKSKPGGAFGNDRRKAAEKATKSEAKPTTLTFSQMDSFL